jgi:hypothetical protein
MLTYWTPTSSPSRHITRHMRSLRQSISRRINTSGKSSGAATHAPSGVHCRTEQPWGVPPGTYARASTGGACSCFCSNIADSVPIRESRIEKRLKRLRTFVQLLLFVERSSPLKGKGCAMICSQGRGVDLILLASPYQRVTNFEPSWLCRAKIVTRKRVPYRRTPTRLTPPFALPPTLWRTAARATGRGLSTTPALATQLGG